MEDKKRKYNIVTLVGGIIMVVVNVVLLVVDSSKPNYFGFIAGIAFIIMGILNLKKGSRINPDKQEEI